MTDYMLTAWASGLGWVDIAVLNAPDMHQAIAVAEKVSGCKVSHGLGRINPGFDPGRTIDMTTGEVTQHHSTPARPLVELGPPDVLAAIAAALKPARARR